MVISRQVPRTPPPQPLNAEGLAAVGQPGVRAKPDEHHLLFQEPRAGRAPLTAARASRARSANGVPVFVKSMTAGFRLQTGTLLTPNSLSKLENNDHNLGRGKRG